MVVLSCANAGQGCLHGLYRLASTAKEQLPLQDNAYIGGPK